MARVTGVREKLDGFLYDTLRVTRPTFGSVMGDPNVIRFFVDVQNKTRLETNMQAAGVLPSLNTFEARAQPGDHQQHVPGPGRERRRTR